MPTPTSTPVVVLDSSVLCQDYLCRGRLAALLAASRRGVIQVCVPQLVVLETERSYKNELDVVEATLQKMGRLGLFELRESAADQVARRAADYSSELAHVFSEHRVEVLPFPKVSHEELVARMFAKRMPFREGHDKGYRDYLIWEAVLAVSLSRAAPVEFLCSNTRDFASHDTSSGVVLHEHLRDDLESRGIAPDRVRLHSSLTRFIDESIRPRLPKHSQLLSYLRIALADRHSREHSSFWALAGGSLRWQVYAPGPAPRVLARVSGPVEAQPSVPDLTDARELDASTTELVGECTVICPFEVFVRDDLLELKRRNATGCSTIPDLSRLTDEGRANSPQHISQTDTGSWWTSTLPGHASVDFIAMFDRDRGTFERVDARVSSVSIKDMDDFIR